MHRAQTPPRAALRAVATSYGARAQEYADRLGTVEAVAEADLTLVQGWARHVGGPIIDVGCGPGHWTHYVSGLGIDARGIDPVVELVDLARASHPAHDFRIGHAEDTGAGDGSIGGVLAWYSLIHAEPEWIGAALVEFRRILRPRGGLAVGFFEGPSLARFEHAIAPAWFWPMDLLVEEITAAGFTVTRTETRTDQGARRHGAILALRN